MSTCGLVMACGRPAGHRGQHGSFVAPPTIRPAGWTTLGEFRHLTLDGRRTLCSIRLETFEPADADRRLPPCGRCLDAAKRRGIEL
jgi:hypothetical protein